MNKEQENKFCKDSYEKEITTDVVIIGAGPTGLFSVFELGLLGIRAHVIETLPYAGGQCRELYPQKPIYDIPGHPVITGQELAENLLRQIEPFHPQFHFEETVMDLEPTTQEDTLPFTGTCALSEGHAETASPTTEGVSPLPSPEEASRHFLLTTRRGLKIHTAVVVIATGGGSFEPRKPPIPHIETFEGKGVLYAVKDIDKLRGQRILIAGGGDSALDWAQALYRIASVTLVHRRPEFRAHEHTAAHIVHLIQQGHIAFIQGEVMDLTGWEEEEDMRHARSLKEASIQTKIGSVVHSCDIFLPFFGFSMKHSHMGLWNLKTKDNRICVNTENFESSQNRVFAIGDINIYPGKLKLVLSGFHEAALMAQKVYAYLHDGEHPFFRYTTSSSYLHEKLGHGVTDKT